MRYVLLLVLMLSSSLFAGYSRSPISEYFTSGDFYYQGILEGEEQRGFLSSKMASSRCVNLQIFDLKAGMSRMLFEQPLGGKKSISQIIFDRSVTSKSNYNSSRGYFRNDRQGDVKDRVIIEVYDSESKRTILWSSRSDGSDLQEIAKITSQQSWHIDVKYSVIRIFTEMKSS